MTYKRETLKKIQEEFDSKPKLKLTNFPVKAANLEYPTSSSVNPLYATSSQQYGVIKPSEFDVPRMLRNIYIYIYVYIYIYYIEW